MCTREPNRLGAYNIVDEEPRPQRVWLPAFALAVNAPAPLGITEEEALTLAGTQLQGAHKAQIEDQLV